MYNWEIKKSLIVVHLLQWLSFCQQKVILNITKRLTKAQRWCWWILTPRTKHCLSHSYLFNFGFFGKAYSYFTLIFWTIHKITERFICSIIMIYIVLEDNSSHWFNSHCNKYMVWALTHFTTGLLPSTPLQMGALFHTEQCCLSVLPT